jgi:putative addiction module component (TIGR02574 family)
MIIAMQSELTEASRKKLSISDRILLVEEIWDTIAEENLRIIRRSERRT